jgi:hypothetical protein
VSRSRPQRSQNWVPRSTIHSTPAQSPGGCATLPTIGAPEQDRAHRWYRNGAALVSFGAGRHRASVRCSAWATSDCPVRATCPPRSTLPA